MFGARKNRMMRASAPTTVECSNCRAHNRITVDWYLCRACGHYEKVGAEGGTHRDDTAAEVRPGKSPRPLKRVYR